MNRRKRVLIAPLDWGLGHAARCIPIIREELALGNEVILASNGRSAALLSRYFPSLKLLTDIPDYSIKYSTRWSFALKMALQLPKILSCIRREHAWVRRAHSQFQFEQIISDNRYGVYLPNVHSVIITHQTAPRVPRWSRAGVHGVIQYWLERFDETWIPDYEDSAKSLAGELSHENVPSNARYIGPLSRFNGKIEAVRNYAKVAIISGPEPYRSVFQREVEQAFLKENEATLILTGKPEEQESVFIQKVMTTSRMDDELLGAVLMGADEVFCRSGYTSIMDFHYLGLKNVRWVPTPGQTEQEYLFKRQEHRQI